MIIHYLIRNNVSSGIWFQNFWNPAKICHKLQDPFIGWKKVFLFLSSLLKITSLSPRFQHANRFGKKFIQLFRDIFQNWERERKREFIDSDMVFTEDKIVCKDIFVSKSPQSWCLTFNKSHVTTFGRSLHIWNFIIQIFN